MSSEDMPVVLGYFDLATTSDEFDIFETVSAFGPIICDH